ncbi:MAG TPA: PspC domain-containing protein, partial [Saprospiraceae bacterium]|nr:PspC domain-containing protein [Saprospiraceae bacterium]
QDKSYQHKGDSSYKYIKTGKKFFRDPDNKVVGGVCSGLAAYIGIADPLWVRIAFAIGFFVGGVSILPYFILMWIVPKAKTAADKLAMKGEPINIENIAKTVENEINEISQTLSNLGSKKKSLDDNDHYSSKFADIAQSGFSIFGSLFTALLSIGRKIFKGVFSIGFFGAIVVLTIMVVALVLVFLKVIPFASFVSPLNYLQTKILMLSVLALIVIPIIGIMMLIGRWFYPNKLKSSNNYLGISWLVSLVVFIVFAAQVGQFFSSFNTSSNLTQLTGKLKNKNIYLTFNEGEYSRGSINFGDIIIRDAKRNLTRAGFTNDIESIDVKVLKRVVIEKSNDADVSILEQFDQVAEEDLTEGILEIKGDNLLFDVNKTINKPSKYFGQKITYKIFLPKGYKVDFDQKFWRYVIVRDGLNTEEKEETVSVSY